MVDEVQYLCRYECLCMLRMERQPFGMDTCLCYDVWPIVSMCVVLV